MSENDDDLDQGSEETEEKEEPSTGGGDTVPRNQYEKVQKEARSLRTRLRRTEVEAKYGKEVVELIPEELPLTKWDEYAEKLSTKLKPEPAAETDTPAEEKPEEATPKEKKLAAVSTAQEGGAEGTTRVSWDEYMAKRAAAQSKEELDAVLTLRAKGLVDE